MAKQRRTGQQAGQRAGRQVGRRNGETGGGGRVALGLLVAAAIAVGGFLLYRHTGPYQASGPRRTKVVGERETAVGRPPAVQERAGVPAQQPAPGATGLPAQGSSTARPTPQAPFGESEEVFETGAKVYVARCASCHGQPGRPAPAGSNATQLWDPHAAAVRHVVAQPAGVIYEQIAEGVAAANGAPAMAGYRHVLSETEMWDVALLLRNAGQELPDPVLHLLHAARR